MFGLEHGDGPAVPDPLDQCLAVPNPDPFVAYPCESVDIRPIHRSILVPHPFLTTNTHRAESLMTSPCS